MSDIKVPVLKFDQPGGTFFSGVMTVKDILSVYVIKTRKYNEGELVSDENLQRDLNEKKTNEIKKYAMDVDATFPTPIIFAVEAGDVSIKDSILFFGENNKIADVIDGQHRIKGLEQAFKVDPSVGDISIPVVFIIDAELEQKAYIFATINSKQTKVSSSLIAELYGVTDKRTPRKVAHEIARALNASPRSPFYKRLKMLGKRSFDGSLESLSQGTFVRELLKLISSDPEKDATLVKRGEKPQYNDKLAFNSYYINNEDEVIIKMIANVFNAIKTVWEHEWGNPDKYIISKTAGFEAVMSSMNKLIELGRSKKDASETFYIEHFKDVKQLMSDEGIVLDSSTFPSQRAGVQKLSKLLLKE